jgi:hypothetical protein
MGIYTDHWARYRQQSTKRTLQALLMFGVGLPTVAMTGYLLSPLTSVRTAVLVAILAAWLVALALQRTAARPDLSCEPALNRRASLNSAVSLRTQLPR